MFTKINWPQSFFKKHPKFEFCGILLMWRMRADKIMRNPVSWQDIQGTTWVNSKEALFHSHSQACILPQMPAIKHSVGSFTDHLLAPRNWVCDNEKTINYYFYVVYILVIIQLILDYPSCLTRSRISYLGGFISLLLFLQFLSS